MEQSTEKLKVSNLKHRIKQTLCVFLLACCCGYIHFCYVRHLHEKYFHYSHLSELERELALHSEQGFYYHYYKTVVTERPYSAAILTLMHDKLVEHPGEVNAINRFNIYPEVILGTIFRYFQPYLHRQCYKISRCNWRGAPRPNATGCVGLGDPMTMYLHGIWVMAGSLVAACVLHSFVLSGSLIGCVITVTQCFANHDEMSKVMWIPNERENFALPLVFLQITLVSKQLTQRYTAFSVQISILLLNCLCLLCWQFSQFIFLTQICVLFIMEEFRIITVKTLCIFLHSHFCGMHLAILLLQGNNMLKSSYYAAFFIVLCTYSLLFANTKRSIIKNRDVYIETGLAFLRILSVTVCSVYVKRWLSWILDSDDDGHIWDLLLSKFTGYKTFHTLIYTTSEYFGFMPLLTIVNLTRTLVLPMVLFVCVDYLYRLVSEGLEVYNQDVALSRKREMHDQEEMKKKADEHGGAEEGEDSGIENVEEERTGDLNLIENKDENMANLKFMVENDLVYFLRILNIDAALVYNVGQVMAFGIMAFLFMRLKVLFAIHLCVISSLVVKTRLFRCKSLIAITLYVVGASIIINELRRNISRQLSYTGEINEPFEEELLTWISEHTQPRDAFAGSIPILSAVMLSTRRPIVSHPHYEHAGARARAYAVSKMYGRFSSQELYEDLIKLKTTYIIIEFQHCQPKSTKGSFLQNIWDIEAPHLAGKPLLCDILLRDSVEHFHRVFTNDHYVVFKIHDLSLLQVLSAFKNKGYTSDIDFASCFGMDLLIDLDYRKTAFYYDQAFRNSTGF